MNVKAQGALEYLIIIAAVLAVAAIIVTMITGILGDRQRSALVTEAQNAASRCNEALVINHIEPGNYTDAHNDTCNNICRGDWLDEEIGTVIGEAETTLTNNYNPEDDDLVEDDDYWVRGACMAGMPGWIVDG